MTVSLCKHGFPLRPPLGSLGNPGDCTGCGITWNACQQELAEQEARNRAGSARPGTCQHCGLHRLLFTFTEEATPWHCEETSTRLCVRCWSDRKEARERNEFVDFDDVFDHGTDEQLARFVGGAR